MVMLATIRLVDPGDTRPLAGGDGFKAHKAPICAPCKGGVIRLRLSPLREKRLN
jgi:hypothetical protein